MERMGEAIVSGAASIKVVAFVLMLELGWIV